MGTGRLFQRGKNDGGFPQGRLLLPAETQKYVTSIISAGGLRRRIEVETSKGSQLIFGGRTESKSGRRRDRKPSVCQGQAILQYSEADPGNLMVRRLGKGICVSSGSNVNSATKKRWRGSWQRVLPHPGPGKSCFRETMQGMSPTGRAGHGDRQDPAAGRVNCPVSRSAHQALRSSALISARDRALTRRTGENLRRCASAAEIKV